MIDSGLQATIAICSEIDRVFVKLLNMLGHFAEYTRTKALDRDRS